VDDEVIGQLPRMKENLRESTSWVEAFVNGQGRCCRRLSGQRVLFIEDEVGMCIRVHLKEVI